MTRLVFGISGASGMPLALGILERFAALPSLEIHLIISAGAKTVLPAEGCLRPDDYEKFADFTHDVDNLSAPPASGSWRHDGMLICPCSMSTLGAIAQGTGHNLIHRAADVTLKERRPLVLVARETPFNLVQLRNMCAATEAGATIMPFIPAFYTGAQDMEAAIGQFSGRLLDQLRIENNYCTRWGEA